MKIGPLSKLGFKPKQLVGCVQHPQLLSQMNSDHQQHSASNPPSSQRCWMLLLPAWCLKCGSQGEGRSMRTRHPSFHGNLQPDSQERPWKLEHKGNAEEFLQFACRWYQHSLGQSCLNCLPYLHLCNSEQIWLRRWPLWDGHDLDPGEHDRPLGWEETDHHGRS